VVRDMPGVGNDLQDHFYVRLAYRCTKPMTLNDVGNSFVRRTAPHPVFPDAFRPARQQWHLRRRLAKSDERSPRPDIQLNFSTWSFAGRG